MRWRVWRCVRLRLRSLFHPICFVGNCFRDSTISGRYHHSSCPRSRVWDVAIHQGIVDQYWLICVTPGNIGAHLCFSPDSVYVINMEDEKQVSHNFFTLQKAPINHKRGTRDEASRRVVVVLLRAAWEQAHIFPDHVWVTSVCSPHIFQSREAGYVSMWRNVVKVLFGLRFWRGFCHLPSDKSIIITILSVTQLCLTLLITQQQPNLDLPHTIALRLPVCFHQNCLSDDVVWWWQSQQGLNVHNCYTAILFVHFLHTILLKLECSGAWSTEAIYKQIVPTSNSRAMPLADCGLIHEFLTQLLLII